MLGFVDVIFSPCLIKECQIELILSIIKCLIGLGKSIGRVLPVGICSSGCGSCLISICLCGSKLYVNSVVDTLAVCQLGLCGINCRESIEKLFVGFSLLGLDGIHIIDEGHTIGNCHLVQRRDLRGH